jgi:hypothetical protein
MYYQCPTPFKRDELNVKCSRHIKLGGENGDRDGKVIREIYVLT